jgi:hypothetical protein
VRDQDGSESAALQSGERRKRICDVPLIAAWFLALAPPAAFAVGATVGMNGFLVVGVWLFGSVGALASGAVAAGRANKRGNRLHRWAAIAASIVGLGEAILLSLLVWLIVAFVVSPPSLPF